MAWAAVGTAARLTISVHTHDEVVTHGPGLAQLVGVAIMYHVIAVESTGVQLVLGVQPCSSAVSSGSPPRSHHGNCPQGPSWAFRERSAQFSLSPVPGPRVRLSKRGCA